MFKIVMPIMVVVGMTSCAGLGKMFEKGKKFTAADAQPFVKKVGKATKKDLIAKFGTNATQSVEKNATGAEFNCHSWFMDGFSPLEVGSKIMDGSIAYSGRLHACFDKKEVLRMIEVDNRIYGDDSLWADNYQRKYQTVSGKPFYVADKNIEIDYYPNILSSGLRLKIKNKTGKIINVNWAKSSLRVNRTQMSLVPSSVPRSSWDSSTQPTQLLPKEEFLEFVYSKNLYRMANYSVVKFPICGQIKSYQKNGTPVINDSGCKGTKVTGIINYDVDGETGKTDRKSVV